MFSFELKNIGAYPLAGISLNPEESFVIEPGGDPRVLNSICSYLHLIIDIPQQNPERKKYLCGSLGHFLVYEGQTTWQATFLFKESEVSSTTPTNVEAGVKE